MPEYFALLDNNYKQGANSYLFTDLVEWVTCRDLSEAPALLAKIEASKFHAAGYITYEFSQFYGFATKALPGGDLPFFEFGLFRKKESLDHQAVDAFLERRFENGAPFIADIEPQISPEYYEQAIASIKDELEAGNTYQVNYTFELLMKQGGCPMRLYHALREAQPVPYGAFLDFPSGKILSRSPELFFDKKGTKITCKPMKGTEPRSSNPLTDSEYRAHLLASPKQRAENLMIVDLLRNDLSRIAKLGSVEVDKLFEVESYKSVHQMTSTIIAQLPDLGLTAILEALFPCGSITGAPKLITTQIIDRLEPRPRGIYCGAIGYHDPNGDMVFNVPIRTMTLKDNQARFNIGGGVVYDSVDNKEYDEALLKGKFLFGLPKQFSLIDSHYFEPKKGAPRLDAHIARLAASAQSLKFRFDERQLRVDLEELYYATGFEAKIRVELDQDGTMRLEALPLARFEGEKFVRLSAQRVRATDPLYQHKTSNRALYDEAFKAAREAGDYDVLFANEKGHLTEAAIHNLVLRFGDEFVTPPLNAGVLPGIGRAEFLAANPNAREDNLPIEALEKADEILLVSALRGVNAVQLRA